MAKKEKAETKTNDEANDISSQLIHDLNKEFGTRVAYNLSTDESPTHVKRWISTGSRLLDYICANRRGGGIPEGRIIEIAGAPSIGKSHIAFHIAKSIQDMGGLVVYIDTENAVPVERLAELGLDVSRRFVYADTHCTEEVFDIAEKTILKAKAIVGKNIPILIVWDSIAATSPRQELENGYDDQSMGLQARVIAKGMRKITGVIGQNNVTMLCLNQVKSKVGMVMGDPTFTPGGAAVPFHASIRIRLQGGKQIKASDGNIVGIEVEAKIIKNKVARPFRRANFRIIFGQGIIEHEEVFDVMRDGCKDGGVVIDDKEYLISGTGAWKEFTVNNSKTGEVLVEKKFVKSAFDQLLSSSEYGPMLDNMLEKIMVIDGTKKFEIESDVPQDPPSDGLGE